VTVQTPPPAPGDAASGGRSSRRRGIVTPYDFRRPTTLAREHSRALEVAFETFARQWSTLLLTRLRQPSQATLVSVDALTYDDYVRGLPAHGVLVTFTPYVGAEPALVQLSARAALDCLDFMLGGRGGTTAEAAERELTEIERRLLEDLVVRTLGDLTYAFAAVMPLEPKLGVVETNPQFLQLAAANDVVIVASLTLAVGEDAEREPDQVSLMLPLGPIIARLQDAGGDRERSDDQLRAQRLASDRLARAVPELPVEVLARFAPRATHPPEVLSLAVGDVVRLRHPTTRPLDVVSNGVVLARAVAGTSGSRLACLVVDAGDSPLASAPASSTSPAEESTR